MESLDSAMFLDHVTLDFSVLKDQRFLIHQMLQHQVGLVPLDIFVLLERPILSDVGLEHTMIALDNPTVLLVVQGTIVHQTQHLARWNALKVITAQLELKLHLIIPVPKATSTTRQEGKA